MKVDHYLQLIHLSYVFILPLLFLVSDFVGRSWFDHVAAILLYIFVLLVPLSVVWFWRGVRGALQETSRFNNVLLGTAHLLEGLIGFALLLGMSSR